MRFTLLTSLLALSVFGGGCKNESVADKYLKSTQASNDSTPAPTTPDPTTPDPTTPDPTTPDPTTPKGDAVKGQALIDSTCKTCHGTAIAMVPLDKTAIPKLDSAKDQPLHKPFLSSFDGEDRLDIEAALDKL